MNVDIKAEVLKICNDAKIASDELAILKTETKNAVLHEVAKLLEENIAKILQANEKDIIAAKERNLENAKIDRLLIDEKRLMGIINAVKEVAKMPDPVGRVLFERNREENNLHIRRVSTPMGVFFAIYESRPNVTIDIASLAFKSGNAVILRSGSDSLNSSKILADIFRQALENCGVDKNAVILVQNSDREYVTQILQRNDYIDVVIPRGGKSLIQAVHENTKIPVFSHLNGNCHVYIHEKADLEKARKILFNAKMRRTGICGATESLLIDEKIAKEILPLIANDLSEVSCEMRGDEQSCLIDNRIKKASEDDFYCEFLDKIISVRIVKNIDEAIKHINKYSSSHTESIISEDKEAVEKFFARINSAIVMNNVSTQFADGGEFGFGGEVGISTGKMHARGPIGLEQLTTFKYVVDSNCAIRN